MHLTAEEFREIEEIFKKDICKQCGICDNIESPDFCTHFFVNNPKNFIMYFIALIKHTRKEKPRLYNALLTPEGFTALFCDKNICPNYADKNCNSIESRISCYQLFKYQNRIEFDPAIFEEMVKDWSNDLYVDLYSQLNIETYNIEHLPRKKRKRLYKSGSASIAKLNKIFNRKRIHKYSNKKTIFHGSTATTKWFGSKEFMDVINNTLEKGNYNQINENSNRKQLSANRHKSAA